MSIATFIKKFNSHDAHPFFQFVKYGIAGAAATAVQIVLFSIFAWKLIPALTPDDIFVRAMEYMGFHVDMPTMSEGTRAWRAMANNLIAFPFSNTVAYLSNILWVFKRGRHGFWTEFGLFTAISLVSFLAGTGIIWLLINYIGMQTTYAFLINIVFSVLINFVFRKFFVFKS